MSAADSGRRLRLRVDFSVSKRADDRNEDCRICKADADIYVLSDGASVSFDSASWAEILSRRYVDDPFLSSGWLRSAISQFNALHDREAMPWMQQAAFDRGSFASLLGMRLVSDATEINVIAIGDSLAVLCDGDSLKRSFPYSKPEQFDQSPLLLSTNFADNPLVDDEEVFSCLTETWSIADCICPIIFLMSDALGHWFLSYDCKGFSPSALLTSLRDENDFAEFVEKERAGGRLRRDDTTLIGIW